MRKYILLLWFPVCLLIGLFILQGTAFAEEFKIKTKDSTWSEKLIISADVRWKDRAHIVLENISVRVTDNSLLTDSDSPLSNEAKTWIRQNSAGINGLGDEVEKNSAGEFKDGNPFDQTAYYGKDLCGKNVEIFKVGGMDAKTDGTIIVDIGELMTSQCHRLLALSGDITKTYQVMAPQQEQFRAVWFRFTSTTTIKNVFTDIEFRATNNTTPNVFFNTGDNDGGACGNPRVDLDKTKMDGNDQAVPGIYETCDTAGKIGVTAWRDNKAALPTTPGPTDGTGAGQDDGCEVQLLNPLTWLMCPLIEAGILAVSTLDNAITSMLMTPTGPNTYFDETGGPGDSGKALFSVWGSFRYIALGILVIAGLLMVISQALSFGIFDAYTIKKVLPRILIGIIGISVSWYLCKFAIDVFNDLGVAVRSLLYGPFKSFKGVTFDAGVVSLLGIGTGVLVVGLGIVGILSFVATALMAVMIAFGILVFRQILIIMLVVTAPLAIACWIMPNTEKVWKMWWDFFIRALVVFPIITLFIAAGRVIAQIALLANNQTPVKTPSLIVPSVFAIFGDSPVTGHIVNLAQLGTGVTAGFLANVIAFIAYFGPYFALPAAFRLAGGAIATVGGLANDRSKGVFDRLKKDRAERWADRRERAQNEKLYNPNNRVAKALRANKVATWAVAPRKNLQYAARNMHIPGLSMQGRQLESGIHAASMEQSEKWLQHVNKHGANDKFYRAVGGMYKGFNKETQAALIANGFATGKVNRDANGNVTSVDDIVASRSLKSEKDFHDMAGILKNSTSDSERKAAVALEANAAYTASMYKDKDMNYASTAVGGAMGLAAHGFFNPDDAADAGNLIADKGETGSTDFAHAAVVQAEAIGASKNPDVKPGYGHVIETYTDDKGKQRQRFVSGNKDPDRSWGAIETFAQGDFSAAKGGFYDKGRTGGKLEEILVAGGKDKAAAHLQQQKWRRELNKIPGMTTEKREAAIKKRLSQRDAIISELRQVADPRYSQAPVDSRAKVTDMLKRHSVSIEHPMGGTDPDPGVIGGAPGPGGPGPGPDLGGPNLQPPTP